MEKQKIIITSGYFDPIHIGHIKYLESAKKLGDYLIVIVNSDLQASLKKGCSFMHEDERLTIVGSLKFVDKTFLAVDNDRTVSRSIEKVIQTNADPNILYIFAKGGDYDEQVKKCPEEIYFKDKNYSIKFVYGIGGYKKLQSSSNLINMALSKP